jgi:hypothetical protein
VASAQPASTGLTLHCLIVRTCTSTVRSLAELPLRTRSASDGCTSAIASIAGRLQKKLALSIQTPPIALRREPRPTERPTSFARGSHDFGATALRNGMQWYGDARNVRVERKLSRAPDFQRVLLSRLFSWLRTVMARASRGGSRRPCRFPTKTLPLRRFRCGNALALSQSAVR